MTSVKKLPLVLATMIVILVISLLALFGFLPPLNVSALIQRQREEIENINEKIRLARDTGNEYIEIFKMESTTRCIWYNSTEKVLKVIFHQEKEPVSIPVDVGWGASGKFNSKDNALISPGFSYKFYITKLGIVDCLNCENNVGRCEV